MNDEEVISEMKKMVSTGFWSSTLRCNADFRLILLL
jgi:hypothetical protein